VTPDQRNTLTATLIDIQDQLHTFLISTPTADDHEANQLIADARRRLENIDTQLFQCFYLLNTRISTTNEKRTPTIDDLEI
jgi:hypothetical protein